MKYIEDSSIPLISDNFSKQLTTASRSSSFSGCIQQLFSECQTFFYIQIATAKAEATSRTGLQLIDTHTPTQNPQINPYYLQT